MLTKAMLMMIGGVIGFLAAISLSKGAAPEESLMRLERNLLVDTAIEAVDALERGEAKGAQLLLASAVNAESQIVFKQRKASEEDLKVARGWQARMAAHNVRLQLTAAREIHAP